MSHYVVVKENWEADLCWALGGAVDLRAQTVAKVAFDIDEHYAMVTVVARSGVVYWRARDSKSRGDGGRSQV
jgi:hypothetical protein